MPVTNSSPGSGAAVLFNGLDQDELRRLAGIAREIALAAGAVLFDQGDEFDGLYVIISGIVRIYPDRRRRPRGDDQPPRGRRGDRRDGAPRRAAAERRRGGADRHQADLHSARAVLELLDTSPKLARQIILTLCERLRAANAQVDQAIFHDLRHRLLVLLRQIAVIHGRVEKDMAVVDLDLTQGTLAQMLGASREAVNKQLRALAKEGRIAMDGHHIQVFKQPRPLTARRNWTGVGVLC